MTDLRIIFSDQKGKRVVKEFDLLMDFMTAFELDDIPSGNKIFAEFFENPLQQKHFDNFQDLYKHCQQITS